MGFIKTWIFPLALTMSACTDTPSSGAADDAASSANSDSGDATPPKRDQDGRDGAGDRIEIGPPAAPLGDCDEKANLEGISAHDWCRRELADDAMCQNGECVSASASGMAEDPKPSTPNPADRAF
jgi:hypothetical protein